MAVQKEEKKTIWDKMGNLDYRIIYTIVAILVAEPLVYPLGTPMTVGQNVKDYAEVIKTLPAGSVVLCDFSGYATMLPDIEPIYLCTWKLLLSRNLKFMVRLVDADAPSIIQMEFTKLKPYFDQNGKVYGTDYMIFPYFSFGEAGEIAFTADIRSMYTSDVNGYSLDDAVHLPMMQTIHNAYDIKLYISGNTDYAVRRYLIPYGVKLIDWGTGTNLLPFVPPYYPNQISGYVGGASQGGELEAYTGFFGDGVMTNDAKNLALVGFLIFVIIGNMAYFGTKFMKR
jgi:hypothetical protein